MTKKRNLFAEILIKNAKKQANAVAFQVDSRARTLSWAEYLQCVKACAAELEKKVPKEKVLFVESSHTLEFAIAIGACWWNGFSAYPFADSIPNLGLATPKVMYTRSLSKITKEKIEPICRIEIEKLLSAKRLNCAPRKQGGLLFSAPSVNGVPRIIEYTAENIFQAAKIELLLNKKMFHTKARILNLRPMHAVTGMYFFVPAIMNGVTSIFSEECIALPIAKKFFQTIGELKPTSIYLSTSHFRTILKSMQNEQRVQHATLLNKKNFMLVGPELLYDEAEAIEKKFGMIPLRRYGMTEYMHALSQYRVPTRASIDPDGFVGHLTKGVRATTQSGVLCFSSKGGARWRREKNKRILLQKNFWFKSQDMGFLSKDRKIFLFGRGRNMITVAGFHFHPAELENEIRQITTVKDVVALGIKDFLRIQKTIAIVTTNESNTVLTEKKIRERLESVLPKYKHPARIIFVNKIYRFTDGTPDYLTLDSLCAESSQK